MQLRRILFFVAVPLLIAPALAHASEETITQDLSYGSCVGVVSASSSPLRMIKSTGTVKGSVLCPSR